MTLNCLSCRTTSQREFSHGNGRHRKACCIMIERNWSGALTSPLPPWGEMREPVTPQSVSSKKVKKGHRRYKSAAVVAIDEINEPRLVRSAGMRRDWSFEDLRQRDALA